MTAEVRGCAVGSYGSPPNCKTCPENSYGLFDAPPATLGADAVCKRCAAGKSTSILHRPGVPVHRAGECSCQPSFPMTGKPVDDGQAAFCDTALTRAKSLLPLSFKFPVGDLRGGSSWSNKDDEERKKEGKPEENLFYHSGTDTRDPTARPPSDSGTVFVSFQMVQRAGTILTFTPVEPEDNLKNNADKRPPSGRECADPPAAFSRSRQMRTLKMWAGDSLTSGSCKPIKHGVDFEVQGLRANTDDDQGTYSGGSGINNAWSSNDNPINQDNVPGVLTVGAACFDRVVYFKASAETCPVDEDTGLVDAACAVSIEVTEIESETCVRDRTSRDSCAAQDRPKSDLLPILGKFTVKGQVEIFGRCVTPHSFGTIGATEIKNRIREAFEYREAFHRRFPESPYAGQCIGGGAACLVKGSLIGQANISVSFGDTEQGTSLPSFCDPDPSDSCKKTELTKADIIEQGPGARSRARNTFLSPLAERMWGQGRRLFGIGGAGGGRNLAKGDESNGGAIGVDIHYTDDSAPSGSKWSEIMGDSPAAKRLVSSVVVDFTIENVRAADAGWAKALVADVLGGGDPIPTDFGFIDVDFLKSQDGMVKSAYGDIDNNIGLGAHESCGVASNIAKALKTKMRPQFVFAHVDFVADSFMVIDEYEPCGLSPLIIAVIVLSSLVGAVIITLMVFCCCRKRGKCGGDEGGRCMKCYSAASAGSLPSGRGRGGAGSGGGREKCRGYIPCCRNGEDTGHLRTDQPASVEMGLQPSVGAARAGSQNTPSPANRPNASAQGKTSNSSAPPVSNLMNQTNPMNQTKTPKLARAPSKQRMSYTSAHKVLGTVDVSSGVQGGLAAAAAAAVAAPPEPPLPSDWSQHYDATSQKYYYHNATTNDTVWTRPLV